MQARTCQFHQAGWLGLLNGRGNTDLFFFAFCYAKLSAKIIPFLVSLPPQFYCKWSPWSNQGGLWSFQPYTRSTHMKLNNAPLWPWCNARAKTVHHKTTVAQTWNHTRVQRERECKKNRKQQKCVGLYTVLVALWMQCLV